MKKTPSPLSATSIARAPRDEAATRMKRYALTMGIRTACFLAMALIQPFGWYTWVLGAAAVFLPYIAVVFANAGTVDTEVQAEAPERAIAAPEPTAPAPDPAAPAPVFRMQESPPREAS